jgi:hypothetical protein
MILLCPFTLVFLPQVLQACCDSIPSRKGQARIHLSDGGMIKGWILGFSDSSVRLIQKKYWNRGLYDRQELIPSVAIHSIMKKNRATLTPLEGLGWGAVAGIGLGAIISFSDEAAEENIFKWLGRKQNLQRTVIISASLGGAGGLLGLIKGKKARKTFHIKGSKDNLRYYRNDILFY